MTGIRVTSRGLFIGILILLLVSVISIELYQKHFSIKEHVLSFAVEHMPESLIYDAVEFIDELRRKRVSETDFAVKGIIVDNGVFQRLNSDVESRIGDDFGGRLKRYSRFLSGGRVEFFTDSSWLGFVIRTNTPVSELGIMMSSGVDLYIDGRYVSSGYSKRNMIALEHASPRNKHVRKITLYLPIWGGIDGVEVYVMPQAISYPPEASTKKIVYYGSSITQGCCASNPGLTYPAIIGRENEFDFYNFGFAGTGVGHLEIINQIIETKPDLVVLDYWANPDATSYKISLPYVLEKITADSPSTKIIVTSTFYNPGREIEQAEKDKISKDVVNRFRIEGFSNIVFAEGLFTREDSIGLYDGRHLNSLGFKMVADRLSKIISSHMGVE